MNQLGSTDLYLGRPAVLFDWRMAKVRLRFRRRTFHVPNQMHTLRINYINYIYPRGLYIPSTWHVRKGLHSEQDGGKRGMCLFFLFRNNSIYLSEMRKIKKKKNLFLKCTRTSNRQKLSNTGYIKGEASRLLRTKSSKTTFEENIILFKQRLRNRGYLDNLIIKLFQKSTSAKECRHYKTN